MWDLEALTEKWQRRWWDAGLQHAVRPAEPDGRPTFFIHFAYPGISGYLHVGHMRGFTYADVLARYKRATGFNVVFPAGFHASGIPAVAFAAEVKRGEKTDYLRQNGYTGDLARLWEPKAVVDYFADVYTNEYWKKFGFLIDERRNCTTIDAGYKRFIAWQFRRLKEKGYLIEKPHHAPYCPVAGPVAVDKSETDIKQGGSAEVKEFVALRFMMSDVAGHDVVLPCATLRPETIFGVTNVWIHPDHDYELVRVWQDGAIADDDANEVWLVGAQGRRKLEWQFERAEGLDVKVRGATLVGRECKAPVTGAIVPVVAGAFVDPQIATGVVMSVPAHAPFDYAAYVDAGLLSTLGDPPQIVDIKGYDDLPARVACAKHGVKSQADKAALDLATDEVYADEFNHGVLNEACGAYAGRRIKAAKDDLRAEFLAADHGRLIRQFSELVISRAGEVVDIRRIPDQDFIHYADEAWTKRAQAHAARMTIRPGQYGEDIANVLAWFGDRACVRRGAWLGTEFPFKPGWIVEPISDSTFYPWYYLVSPYVGGSDDRPLSPEMLTDAFFDFVFNGKGEATEGAKAAFAEASDKGGVQDAAALARLWRQIRDDVTYWGPIDVNLGGKEHQTVHFPVYIMNQVALLDDEKMWPRGIFVNWWVTQKAGAKISKSKGGAEPIPGAAKKYGVDPMRLYYCHVGSAHVDIEWDPDIVLTYRRQVERLARFTQEILATQGGPTPMDGWLEAAWAQTLETARQAYEAQDLRQAATALAYTFPEQLRWYQRRGGADGGLLRRLAREWAIALCPLVPHVAEEMFSACDGEGLATTASFPPPVSASPEALDEESYIRSVLADLQTIERLAGVDKPTSLTFYVTPAWKLEVVRLALALAGDGKFPMGAFMGQVMADPAMRQRGKAVQAFCGKLPALVMQLGPEEKRLLAPGFDEAAALRRAASFLAQEVGLESATVVASDDPEAPPSAKRDLAAPLRPGIALA